MDMLERVRIENALKTFAEANGYKCRPGFKDAEVTTCRGPQNLHLKYEPALNKSEFLMTFSWLNSGKRNHDEFLNNVSKFTDYMKTVVGEKNVRIANT